MVTASILARNVIVSPTSMDAHSHSAGALAGAQLREGRSPLAQGMTTVIGNPDGGGLVDLPAQAAQLTAVRPGLNVALVIGHATARNAVMGASQRREPTPDELEKMRAQGRPCAAIGR